MSKAARLRRSAKRACNRSADVLPTRPTDTPAMQSSSRAKFKSLKVQTWRCTRARCIGAVTVLMVNVGAQGANAGYLGTIYGGADGANGGGGASDIRVPGGACDPRSQLRQQRAHRRGRRRGRLPIGRPVAVFA
jgi:hypothetical protein